MFKYLKTKVRDNTVALAATTGLSSLFRLLSNLILARLLFPEAFAIAGIIGSLIFVMEMVSDFGFHAYIVRHPDGDKKSFLDTLWSLKLLRGIILTGVMAALSWPIAQYVNHPEIQPAVFVSSFVFLLIGIETFGEIISDRYQKASKPLYIGLLAQSISILITIVLALIIRSYWALVAGLFINQILILVFSYVLYADARRSFLIRREYIPEFFNFAKVVLPTSFITIFLVQGDKVIVSKTLSLLELGLYYIALNISVSALKLATDYPRRVLYPVLAEGYRDQPDQLKDLFYEKKYFILLGLCFLVGLLAGGAGLFFDLLYDERYQSAAKFLSILLIHPVLCTISYSAETCIIATGKIGVALIGNILRLIWVVVASYAGFTILGSIGVIWAFATIEILPIIYLLWKLGQSQLLVIHKEIFNLVSAFAGYLISYQASEVIYAFLR